MNTPQTPTPAVDAINRLLASEMPEERAEGERRLAELLADVGRKVDRAARMIRWTTAAGAGAGVLAIIVSFTSLNVILLAATGLFVPGVWSAHWFGVRVQTGAARGLAGLEDVRAIPPLMDVLVNGSAIRARGVNAVLVPLLNRVRPWHESLLDARLAKRFRATLTWNPDQSMGGEHRYGADVVIAVLNALIHIGDEAWIGTVERLEAGTGNRRVRHAADHCLKVLRARRVQQHHSRSLLRPVASPSPAGDLLRPAGATDAEPSQLLRPSAPDSD